MLQVKISSTPHNLMLMKNVIEISLAIILQSQNHYFQVIDKNKASEHTEFLTLLPPCCCV